MSADILLLAKSGPFCRTAADIARAAFGDRLAAYMGSVGDPLPEALADARPTFLISFLSPWIVPPDLLARSGTAINFHPGSTDYPGIGCYNFALYEEAQEFGAVCHHMLPRVDTGQPVEERRFALLETDTVEVLKLRTMVTMTAMFHDICTRIARGEPLPRSERCWSRRPFTRRELHALKVIEPDMDAQEVRRRVRASTYPGYPGASVTIGGETFFSPVPDRPPLA